MRLDGWLDGQMTERNLDFTLFRLNRVKLLFLFKSHHVFNFPQAAVFAGEGC